MNNDYGVKRMLYDGVNTVFKIQQVVTIEEQVDLFVAGVFVERDPGPANYMVTPATPTSPTIITLTNDFITTFNPAVGDLIEIVMYYTSTDKFVGDVTGSLPEYTLSQPVDDVQKLIVDVNGIRQLAGVDYTLVDLNVIRFYQQHLDTDEIIITAFTGSNSTPRIAFRLFLNNIEARTAEDTIKPLADSTLDEDILSTDLLISIGRITGFPSQGIIFVGTDVGDTIQYEQIKYIGFDIDDNLIVIERGVNNTVAVDHFINDIVILLNPDVPQLATFESHRISDDGKAILTQDLELGDTEIHLNRVAGLPKQASEDRRLKNPGVIWIGTERIEFLEREGTILKQITRGTKGTSGGVPAIYDINGDLVSDVFTGGTLTYPTGTVIIDGSNKQRIPGGYEWEANKWGLQYSNSSQARFLLDKPGSC